MTQTIPARSLTVNGERTRAKIVDSAATLMLNDGVAGTTIEGGCATAGVGRCRCTTTSMTRRNWFGL